VDELVGLSAILVAWTALTLAGFLVAWAWGAPKLTAVLAGMPVAFGLVAAAAFLQPIGNLSFSLVSVAWFFLVVGLTGLLGRGAFHAVKGSRHSRPPESSGPLPEHVGLVLLGTTLFAAVVYLHVTGGTLETTNQGWDAVGHQNVVHSIVGSGVANPWHVQDFMVPAGSAAGGGYYPSAFQSVAALVMTLLGSDAVVASNVTAVLLAGALWPSACMLLAGTVLGRSTRVLAWSGLLSLGFFGMPWGPAGYGVLWPTATAAAFTPLLLAGAVGMLGLQAGPPARRRAGVLGVGGAVGIGLGHPRGLLLVLPVLMIILLYSLVRRLVLAARTGSWAWPAAAAAAGAAAVVLTLAALARVPDSAKLFDVGGGITQTFGEALVDHLANGPNESVRGLLVALLVAIGSIVALRSGRLAWLPVAYLVLVLLDVATATYFGFSSGWTGYETFFKFSRFWYNDRYRIGTVAPMVGVLLATLGGRAVWTWAQRLGSRAASPRAEGRHRSRRRILASPVTGVLGALVVVATMLPGPLRYLGHWYIQMSEDPHMSLISPDELQFYQRLSAIVPPGDRVLNNAPDGSALIYAYTDRRPVFYTLYDTPSTVSGLKLRESLVTDEDRGRVCQELRDDRIDWVLNGGLTWSDNAVHDAPAPGMQVPPNFPLTTLVAESGHMRLYKVTGCS